MRPLTYENTATSLITLIAEKLDAKGIDLVIDGTTYIYVDRKTGIKVVDFKNGLGPISSALALNGDLIEIGELVQQALPGVVLSDNQMSALTSFAHHIGIDNFTKSKVFDDLTQTPPDYLAVPAHMKRWRVGTTGGSKKPKVRQDYVDRRKYEGVLFNTPDACEIGHLLRNKSSATFAQLTAQIITCNLQYIARGGVNL